MANVAVLYYSKSGNTRAMAEHIAAGAAAVEGVCARSFPIDAVDEEWVKGCKCVILGTPVYGASFCAAIKVWIENDAAKRLELAGKIGGAFATERYVHGGGDLAIRNILDHMMVFGMLTYSGGAAFGVPPIHLGPVAAGNTAEEQAPFAGVFEEYGRRMATTTQALFG